MKYTVQFVQSADDIPKAVWDRCFAPPVEGLWWYQALERAHLEDQFTFEYGVIFEDGIAVGIAPTFLMNVPIDLVVPPNLLPIFSAAAKIFPSIKYQRTFFVGSPCSDEGTIGLLPHIDREAAFLALQQAFEKRAKEHKAPMLVWKDFPSAYAPDLERLSAAAGLFRLVSYPGAVIHLPSSSKDDYYAAMKASRRQKIKRKLRLSSAAVDLTVEVAEKLTAETLDEIFGLFTQTYKKATTKFEKLGMPFFKVIAEEPRSRFILLRERASGKLAAFMLCFAVGDRLINKFIGIDYSRPKDWVLYFRLWDAAVDWALAKGFTSIQSGQTGYSAKIELGNDLVPLTNYCRHCNWLVHAIQRAVAKSIDWHTLDEDLAAHLKAHPDAHPIKALKMEKRTADPDSNDQLVTVRPS